MNEMSLLYEEEEERRRHVEASCSSRKIQHEKYKNGTGKTSQAVTPFHFFDYFNFYHLTTVMEGVKKLGKIPHTHKHTHPFGFFSEKQFFMPLLKHKK